MSDDITPEEAAPKERLPGATHDEQLYVPAPGEKQLTARAVIVGCLVGSIIACTNIYIGLKIGWTFGASIVSAVLGFAMFRMAGKSLSVLETNITQTAGSGAGAMASAAGLVAAIPAMQMMGHQLAWWELALWTFSVAFLGVFFAVPLRRQMVVTEKLRFPTGTATASTVVALLSDAAEAAAKARVLVVSALIAGALALASHFVPAIEMPPVHQWLGFGVLVAAADWGFKVYLGPALFGAGFLIGPRVGISLLIGSIVGWGVLGPMASHLGWVDGEIMSVEDGARGWILWPGVALMVSEAMMTLLMSWRSFVRALRPAPKTEHAVVESEEDAIPNSWWMGGLAAGTLLVVCTGYLVFEIAPWMTVIAVALSAVLAVVAVRSAGESDINPIGPMGKVTQLVYGALAPGQAATNLMSAAITGAGASQAADMMQDLKTGYLLGASPRKQFVAQLIGICSGILFVVPAYYLMTAGVDFSDPESPVPAPAARVWFAMAELLTQGLDSLPTHAGSAVAIACLVGALLAVLRKVERIAKFLPSGMAMGLAFVVQPYYSFPMVLGLVVWAIWNHRSPTQVSRFNFAMASGLVVGEGLMGLVKAGLTLAGIGAGH